MYLYMISSTICATIKMCFIYCIHAAHFTLSGEQRKIITVFKKNKKNKKTPLSTFSAHFENLFTKVFSESDSVFMKLWSVSSSSSCFKLLVLPTRRLFFINCVDDVSTYIEQNILIGLCQIVFCVFYFAFEH